MRLDFGPVERGRRGRRGTTLMSARCPQQRREGGTGGNGIPVTSRVSRLAEAHRPTESLLGSHGRGGGRCATVVGGRRLATPRRARAT